MSLEILQKHPSKSFQMSLTSTRSKCAEIQIFIWISKNLRDLINSEKLNNKFFNVHCWDKIKKDNDVKEGRRDNESLKARDGN